LRRSDETHITPVLTKEHGNSRQGGWSLRFYTGTVVFPLPYLMVGIVSPVPVVPAFYRFEQLFLVTVIYR
jgi:hypothetical protein